MQSNIIQLNSTAKVFCQEHKNRFTWENYQCYWLYLWIKGQKSHILSKSCNIKHFTRLHIYIYNVFRKTGILILCISNNEPEAIPFTLTPKIIRYLTINLQIWHNIFTPKNFNLCSVPALNSCNIIPFFIFFFQNWFIFSWATIPYTF